MKGKNRTSRNHSFAQAGGPGSKKKGNEYGTKAAAAKYAAQWSRTEENKARNREKHN